MIFDMNTSSGSNQLEIHIALVRGNLTEIRRKQSHADLREDPDGQDHHPRRRGQ